MLLPTAKTPLCYSPLPIPLCSCPTWGWMPAGEVAALETCLSGLILGLTPSPALPMSICLSGHSSDVTIPVFFPPRTRQKPTTRATSMHGG